MLEKRLRPAAQLQREVDLIEDDFKKLPLSEQRDLERKFGKSDYIYSKKVTVGEIENEISDYPKEEKELLTKLEPDEARTIIDQAKTATEVDNPNFFDPPPQEEPSEQSFNNAQTLSSLREAEKTEE